MRHSIYPLQPLQIHFNVLWVYKVSGGGVSGVRLAGMVGYNWLGLLVIMLFCKCVNVLVG